MAVQLQIPFETLIELVEQLPQDQQQALVRHLQDRTQQKNRVVEEKMRLLRSAQFHGEVKEEPSPRREDWYDDDGR